MADYTLLIYMIGSDFESRNYSATQDIEEMKKAADPSGINIVLQTGGGLNSAKPANIDFSKVQRHQIVNGTLHTLMNLGLKSMAEPNTLSDFIKWGISNYPAKKYAIVFWDHGSGINGFGKDINFNNAALDPFELQRGIHTGLEGTQKTFELIGFDACLMSSLEVASKINYYSPYMVSSEEIVPEWGWDYTSIVNGLAANPHQSGYLMGKSIIDSYSNSSKHLSESEKFGTQKEITLSLIDMTMIPQLVKDVNGLSKSLKSKISDVESAISLSKSIDMTEHYGQSASGSTGLIDVYDFSVNLQEKYPDLAPNIKAVQNSINSSVVYSYNGDARPNAKGISVYMPLFKSEYSGKSELNVVDTDWLLLLYTQRFMMEIDTQPPVIKSIREGNTIKGGVYGSDVSNVFAEIITNSSNGSSLKYVQNIEPTFIDSMGNFHYKDPKMLVLCNETECIPSSANLEINRDKKFVFLPIRLESENSEVNNNASLVYEIDKNNQFEFLGINPNTNPGETIPKGKTALKTGDKVFLKSLPAKASIQKVGEISSRGITNISAYSEDGPLLVSDPEKMAPKYVDAASQFAVRLTICDYADNCDYTRWYQINSGEGFAPPIPPPPGDEFGYDVITKKSGGEPDRSQSADFTYVNPTYGFKVSYPQDWSRKSQNISDFSDYDLFADPMIVEFIPHDYKENPGSGFYPSLLVQVTDWPFRESPKLYFDYFNGTGFWNATIIQAEPTVIAGNPGFKFIQEYLSPSEQKLGVAKEKRKEMTVSVLVNGRMYVISFGAYNSQFDRYLPTVEKIIDSFGPHQIQGQTDGNNTQRISKSPVPTKTNEPFSQNVPYDTKSAAADNQNLTGKIRWSKYADTQYPYSIDYPSNLGVGKPILAKDFNPKMPGIAFDLENSSMTPELKEGVTLLVNAFHIGEKDREKFSIVGMPYKPLLESYDMGYFALAANETISFRNNFPNFLLLENKTLDLKNYTAYTIESRYFVPQARDIVHEKLVYVTNGQDLVTFNFMAGPQKYPQYLPVFQEMLNSFEFQKKK
jgi:hypothetical protein